VSAVHLVEGHVQVPYFSMRLYASEGLDFSASCFCYLGATDT
jgi:hypothetical protein